MSFKQLLKASLCAGAIFSTTALAVESYGNCYYILKIGGNAYHIPVPCP